MATVLERFNKLGLAYSNPVLGMCGEFVASKMGHFDEWDDSNKIRKKKQVENGQVYYVNDYPGDETPWLDLLILDFVSKKPKEWERFARQNWWSNYKRTRSSHK